RFHRQALGRCGTVRPLQRLIRPGIPRSQSMTDTASAPPSGPPYTRWTSTGAFLLAAVGAGIGLGSIWRFPYVTGANGGGAFVLIYLLTVFGVVMPVLVAELLIGRRGGGSPSRSIALMARGAGASPMWRV